MPIRNLRSLTKMPGIANAILNGGIVFKDGDYYKKLLPDGSLAVQDLDRNGNPIKHTYIGSNAKTAAQQNREVRAKFWEQNPIQAHAVDSIANEYNINPALLRDRINHEGYTDLMIHHNNGDARNPKNVNTYEFLNSPLEVYDAEGNPASPGFVAFGLDDVATYLKKGQIKLINENWSDSWNTNEKGRRVNTADGHTVLDNIGITAATLKYMREKASKDFPKASRAFLDEAAGIYYNYGPYGGKIQMSKKKK